MTPDLRLDRRSLLKATAVLPLAGAGARLAGERRRPNIVFLVSDDQGRELGAFGNPAVRTPHTDRLVREGCLFENAYTPVSVCMPSRSVLYTGLYPPRNGSMGFEPVRRDVPLWGELLSGAGYFTGLIGKLNVQPKERFRFDFMELAKPNAPESRQPAWYVGTFEKMLAARDDKPFCTVVSFRDPHRPFPADGGGAEHRHLPEHVRVPPSLVDTPKVRIELALFYDAIHRMDRAVGGVLDALEREKLVDDTLVVFTSDNGIPFPFAKTTLYEAGIRMPLALRWPGVVAPGSRSPAFVSFVDLLPTCLALAGAKPDASFDGESLTGILAGETDSVRDAVFGMHTRHREAMVPSRSVRIGSLKYIVNPRPGVRFENEDMRISAAWSEMVRVARDDPGVMERARKLQHRPVHELYDLESDPHELANVAEDEDRGEARRELEGRLLAFLRSVDDPLVDEVEARIRR